MMRVAIDRIESGIAILIGQEDPRIRLSVPVSLLPDGSKEGDILTLHLEPDADETRAVGERVALLQDRLKRKPG
jgi:hypothetical protein